jgi:hypothetical protein
VAIIHPERSEFKSALLVGAQFIKPSDGLALIAMSYITHPPTIKIKVMAWGDLGHARRPALLKQKAFSRNQLS